jgi:hypothetical protein
LDADELVMPETRVGDHSASGGGGAEQDVWHKTGVVDVSSSMLVALLRLQAELEYVLSIDNGVPPPVAEKWMQELATCTGETLTDLKDSASALGLPYTMVENETMLKAKASIDSSAPLISDHDGGWRQVSDEVAEYASVLVTKLNSKVNGFTLCKTRLALGQLRLVFQNFAAQP